MNSLRRPTVGDVSDIRISGKVHLFIYTLLTISYIRLMSILPVKLRILGGTINWLGAIQPPTPVCAAESRSMHTAGYMIAPPSLLTVRFPIKTNSR